MGDGVSDLASCIAAVMQSQKHHQWLIIVVLHQRRMVRGFVGTCILLVIESQGHKGPTFLEDINKEEMERGSSEKK